MIIEGWLVFLLNNKKDSSIPNNINAGKRYVYTASDGWTILTKDGLPSAHFEHTIAITDNGPKILSVGSNG